MVGAELDELLISRLLVSWAEWAISRTRDKRWGRAKTLKVVQHAVFNIPNPYLLKDMGSIPPDPISYPEPISSQLMYVLVYTISFWLLDGP